MQNDAIAIANYFVKKGNEDISAPDLTLLRLVKYVYIAYGFALSVLNKVIIDKRFDEVQAWKYGPVIPSVYHSFKHNRDQKITKECVILKSENDAGELHFETPEVEDERIKIILDFVWERYKGKTTPDLINILHAPGTPWAFCYRVGQNVEIPDKITKVYYDALVNS